MAIPLQPNQQECRQSCQYGYRNLHLLSSQTQATSLSSTTNFNIFGPATSDIGWIRRPLVSSHLINTSAEVLTSTRHHHWSVFIRTKGPSRRLRHRERPFTRWRSSFGYKVTGNQYCWSYEYQHILHFHHQHEVARALFIIMFSSSAVFCELSACLHNVYETMSQPRYVVSSQVHLRCTCDTSCRWRSRCE